MAVKRTETCYTCRHWLGYGPRGKGPRGECRRLPPTVTSRAPFGAFPVTHMAEWCGEWQTFASRPDTLYD